MNFQTIKQQLSSTTQAELSVISTGSGVPLPTLIKIKYGQTRNPRIETVESLSYYFSNRTVSKKRKGSQ